MTSADSLRQVLLRSSNSVRKASQGKNTIFPVIYPPHLHREFRIAWGFSLCCNLTHSHMPDAVPVRRTNGLPGASFRFHLTMDTLAFGYALGAIPCARDFHPLDCAHAWHTKKGRSERCGPFHFPLSPRLSPLVLQRRPPDPQPPAPRTSSPPAPAPRDCEGPSCVSAPAHPSPSRGILGTADDCNRNTSLAAPASLRSSPQLLPT